MTDRRRLSAADLARAREKHGAERVEWRWPNEPYFETPGGHTRWIVFSLTAAGCNYPLPGLRAPKRAARRIRMARKRRRGW